MRGAGSGIHDWALERPATPQAGIAPSGRSFDATHYLYDLVRYYPERRRQLLKRSKNNRQFCSGLEAAGSGRRLPVLPGVANFCHVFIGQKAAGMRRLSHQSGVKNFSASVRNSDSMIWGYEGKAGSGHSARQRGRGENQSCCLAIAISAISRLSDWRCDAGQPVQRSSNLILRTEIMLKPVGVMSVVSCYLKVTVFRQEES
jgi:hypothetical protein